MIKLLGACAIILCAFFYTGSLAQYSVTEQQLENSYSFINDINLYTIRLTNTSLHVNSTDKNFKACTMAIDPAKDFTRERIQAKALTSAPKFVTWGIRSLEIVRKSEHETRVETEHTVLLIDPWDCSYKSVELPAYSEEFLYCYTDIAVVANADSFDVFHPGQKNCSPCRFDANGKQVELDYQLEIPTYHVRSSDTGNILHMQPIDSNDRQQGYFFAYNFYNDSAVIEHLDEHFKTLKRMNINHPVHSVSIWPEKNNPLFSICYNYDPQHLEVYCQQLDSNLQSKLSFRLPVPVNHVGFNSFGLTHQIDSLGNIYIGLIEESYEYLGLIEKKSKITTLLRYFVYDKTGKLLESHDFDKLNAVLQISYGSKRLHSQLLPGDKFCLFDEELIANEMKNHQIIRCFNIAKYYEPSK